MVSDSSRPHGLQPTRLLGPWDFPGKNTGLGFHFLLQGIFPTQGCNPRLLCLLHCGWILYQLSYQGSPLYSLDLTYLTKDHLSCGEGNGNPLQYSCLANPMDGGAWWAAVHGVTRSWTQLSNFTFTFHFHELKKEIATHSSVLAQRIPGTGEPGGLPSLGSHRVGHD